MAFTGLLRQLPRVTDAEYLAVPPIIFCYKFRACVTLGSFFVCLYFQTGNIFQRLLIVPDANFACNLYAVYISVNSWRSNDSARTLCRLSVRRKDGPPGTIDKPAFTLRFRPVIRMICDVLLLKLLRGTFHYLVLLVNHQIVVPRLNRQPDVWNNGWHKHIVHHKSTCLRSIAMNNIWSLMLITHRRCGLFLPQVLLHNKTRPIVSISRETTRADAVRLT